MLKRTERVFKRRFDYTGRETVRVTTYWLFSIIPIYTTEEILSSTEV